jgi:hypothetical protein
MNLSHLPADFALILRYGRGPLKTVSVRLDDETLNALDELSERLKGPSRGSLLRYLITKGIQASTTELDSAEA